MLGEGRPRIGTPALEARDVGGLGHRRLGGELVFAGVDGQLFEGELHLIDQQPPAFGLLAVDLAFELGDPELLVGDEGEVVASPRPGDSDLGFQNGGGLARATEHRLEGGDIVGKVVQRGVHDRNGITENAA
jgi:hypothetical protein